MNDVMQSQRRPEPSEDFADPRLAGDFQARHWPLCDGAVAPPAGAADLHERRCLEFLAAYYRINYANGAVLDAHPPEQASARAELAAAMQALEELEDRYAPIGFFGDPVMNDVFYADIRFVRPELSRRQAPASTASSFLAVPGLTNLPSAELQGQPTIRRWSHGEAHS